MKVDIMLSLPRICEEEIFVSFFLEVNIMSEKDNNFFLNCMPEYCASFADDDEGLLV